MLTTDQRSEFEERGFVRLHGVFSRAEAWAMEERVWERLNQKHGVCRDDPGSWAIPPASGLQPLRSHAVFEPNNGPSLLGALDDLLGEGRWERPKHWGQFLVSFPVRAGGFNPANTLWHTDFPYFLPADRLVGALVFSFIGEVPAGSGGTLVIAGSPRIVARFIGANPHLRKLKMKVARRALMNSDPWLKALSTEFAPESAAAAPFESEQTIGDVHARVVELTGEPGDVVIGHPWLLHSPAPNRGDRPRMMRVQRVRLAG